VLVATKVPGKPHDGSRLEPSGALDGILDPTDLFGELAYSIDLPNRQLLAFDPKDNGLDLTHAPKDGAIVRWIRTAAMTVHL